MATRVRTIVGGIAIAVLMAVGMCMAYPQVFTKRKESEQPAPITVQIERAELVETWNAMTQFSGIIKAKRRSELSFERIGRVDKVLVDKGTRVERGQLLARLNTDMLEVQIRKLEADRQAAMAMLAEMKAGPRIEIIEAARATVQDFDAQLQLAQRNLERRQRLVNTQAISREDFEQAQSTVVRLQAARTNAQKTLEDLELGTRKEKISTQEATIASLEESIASCRVEVEHSAITSPYAGSIIDRHIHEGYVVSPGTPALVISEDTALEAHFGIPPNLIPSLSIGSSLTIIVRGQSIPVTLKSIVPQVDDETRTLRVVVAIDAVDANNVLPGDIAKLELSRPQTEQGYWLPTEAVMQGQRGLWECYVVESTVHGDTTNDDTRNNDLGMVVRRSIEILHTEGDRVLVRGALRSGDAFVCTAVNRLVVGQVVRTTERGRE